MSCDNQISTQDLINAKTDAVTLGEVATSRAGAESSGSSITESTNRFGGVTDTVQGRLNKLGVIYDDPIRDWSASLLVNDLRAHRYPAATGDIYIPVKPLPFTTGATFNTSDWEIFQGLSSQDLINALSQPYEFDSYQSMISNSGSVNIPENKKLSTGAGSWRATTTVTPSLIANTSPQLYAQPLNGVWINDFGVNDGDDFSVEFRLAITLGTVRLPAKRYIYDGVAITTDFAKVKGAGAPNFKSGYTGLEGGSIIEGTFSFSGENGHFTDFGIDLGTDTAASSGDGMKCTTTLDAGGHLHVENIIALGKNTSDAFHSLLFESYTKVTGGNLTGVNNWFSIVFKCQNVQLSSLFGYNSEKRGLYLKSDAIFGKCNTFNVDSVLIDGNGQPGQGLYIQSDGAQIERVQLGKVQVKGYPTGAEINDTGIAAGINNIKITEMMLVGTSGVSFFINTANAFTKDLQIGSLSIIDCEAGAILTNGFVAHLQITNLFISYKAGTLDAVMEDAVKFTANVTKTTISNVTICRSYSTDEASLGWINYENNATVTPENNIVGNRLCKIKGLGVPQNGLSILAGTPTTFTPSDNKLAPKHTIITQLTAGTTITRIENERYTGVQFETGAILTVINESNQILRLAHDPSNFIRNKGSVELVLGGTDAANYTMSNTGVWTEL